MLRVPLAHAAYREMDLHISTDRMIAYFRCHHRAWYEQHGLQPLLSLLPLLRPLQLWIERVRRHSHFSIKGTLPYPKPTPSENPRRKLKKLKNSKPPCPRCLDAGCLVGEKRKKKKLRIRAARIPAETATRSFRKMDYSFKDTPGFIISPTQRVS